MSVSRMRQRSMCICKRHCLSVLYVDVVERRNTADWTAFAKYRDIFNGNTGTCLKRQVYNACVLPAMTYGAETWTLIKPSKEQASNRTNKDRTKLFVKHRIPEQKNKHLDKRKDNGHRCDWTSQKTDVYPGRTRQQITRKPMVVEYQHLETI